MRVLELALAGVLAASVPIAAHASERGSNARPTNAGSVPSIAMAWDGEGSRGRSGTVGSGTVGSGTVGSGTVGSGTVGSGTVGAHPTVRQWNGGWVQPHWGPNGHPLGWGPNGWPGVPTYWVWGPSGGAFDYPFADWRGPTGGWGNP
jgi:hypothetical protein